MKIGSGLQGNSGGELKLYLGCTGSTSHYFLGLFLDAHLSDFFEIVWS